MQSAKNSKHESGINQWKSGSALVIVLAFLVLLTALAVAYFSRTITERQVSNSSVNQIKAEILAHSAADTIVGDLKQEIVAGSSTPSPTAPPGYNAYTPLSGTYVMPQQSGIPSGNAIPNLIRVSVRNDPLVSGSVKAVGTSASAVNSSTDLSANGRSVNLSRWNAHYLIPTVSGSGNTPVSTFTAPDWVMVTKTGPKVLTAPDPTTIGRYAYAIYDEGGLLDANVAGCPTILTGTATGPAAASKGFAAFADLTALGLSQNQVDSLVGWRNYATGQPSGSLASGYTFASGTNYYNYILGGTNGFLSVNSFNYASGTDPGSYTAAAMTQSSPAHTDQAFPNRQALIKFWSANFSANMNALQYLGTFTRDNNAPNFTPYAYPAPVGTFTPALVTYPNNFNTTVQNAFFTGTASSSYGLPVVSHRFALSNLGMLSDPAARTNAALKTKIKHYFGLTPAADGYTWAYTHGGGNFVSILPLTGSNSVASLSAPREAGYPQEPDFFELLQAAVLYGSLGVTFPANPSTNPDAKDPDIVQQTIMQMGADIIDQYDPDSTPTAISFTNAWSSNGTSYRILYVAGIENLPYFSEVMLWPYRPQSDPDRYTLNGYLLVELWNPNQNASSIAPPAGSPTAFVPSEFRLCLDARGNYLLLNKNQDKPANTGIDQFTPLLPVEPNAENSNGSVHVAFNNSTRFQEPTVLDTSLVVVADSSSPGNSGTAGWNTLTESGSSRSGFLVGTGTFPDSALSASLGLPVAPYRYSEIEFTFSNPHIHLQFQDAAGAWHDYQGQYQDFASQSRITLPITNGDMIGNVNSNSPFNPQVTTDTSFNTFNFILSTSVQSEDPRISVLSCPYIGQSTYNKSVRPGPGQPGATASKSGATASVNIPISYPSYASPTTAPTYPGMYNENDSSSTNAFISANPGAPNTYVVDMDGVIRHGDGYFGADPFLSGSLVNRPIILNRPFRSVGEMGYAWRGETWKSINFFSPESADAGLLDYFSIDQAQVAAGKINLNTRQPVTLQAMLQGAYRIEPLVSGSSETITSTEAASLAQAIIAHTATSPLLSRADLVRGLLVDPDPAITSGTDVKTIIDSIGTGSGIPVTVKAKREAFVRALADVGTTRTWNLLIDIVAQTGNYPPNATALSQFVVQGEKHYWLHVAIDRYSGEIIDQQLESVNE